MFEPITQFLLNEGYAPHGYCLLWDPGLVWVHIASDLAIAAAYFAIPAALWLLATRRPDLNSFGILNFFGLFIIFCGLTHLIGVITMWMPLYGLSGIVKALTAMVSIVTAMLVWRVLGSVLSTPSQADLRRANEQLERLNAELEQRVERRTAELAEANRNLFHVAMEAREADRVKNDFLARVSHELRTPLNAIIGFTDLMRSGISGQLSRKHAEYCDNVNAAARHLLEEINDILDLERLADPGSHLDPEPVALREEVERLVRMNQTVPGFEEARFDIDIEQDFEVFADRRSLATILTNLISNALKYSPDRPRVAISARGINGSGQTEIRVRDNGIGIPAAKIADVFEPFVRAHEKEQPTIGGTGLGLPLVRMLAEAHGGSVDAESEVAVGTTMILRLPGASAASHPPFKRAGQVGRSVGSGEEGAAGRGTTGLGLEPRSLVP